MRRLLAAGLIGLALCDPGAAQTAPAGQAPDAPASAAATPFLAASSADLLVSNLIDLSVYNAQNQRVGEVEDLVMDGAKGVRAIIVSVGPFLGGGERHVVVDPSALQVIREANGSYRAVLNVTADQIRAAPEFKYRGAWSE